MRKSGCLQWIGGFALLGVLLAAIYLLARPSILRWGASDAELSMPLPGDELITDPERNITRAITIEAPAERVWAWVAQSGADRGGLYSYTAIEGLIACPIVNADRIHPDWQNPQPGDSWAMCPGGSGPPPYQVAQVDPGKALVLGHQEDGGWFDTWTFAVVAVDADTTRLIHRSRTAVDQAWVKAIEPGMFFMERGMMRGVRARAEGWALDPSVEDPYRWAFLALLAGYLGARLVYHRRGRSGETQTTGIGAGLQKLLIGLATLAVAPAVVYALSDGFSFGHLPLPGIVRVIGALLFLGGDLLFWASHRALKKNWSAEVEIQAGHTLVTDGPYRRVRHPMYTALFLIGAGMLLLSANWLAGGLFLLAFTLLYLTRVDAEERLLRDHFGAAYEAYMKETGRLLPKF